MNTYIEIISGATSILTNQSLSVSFFDCLSQFIGFKPELSSNVDIRSFGSHSEAHNKSAFYQFVRIVPQDFSVLASARLRLVRINNKIGRTMVKEVLTVRLRL